MACSAGLEHMVGLAAALWHPLAALRVRHHLLGLDMGEDGPQALVLHDVGLRHLADLVEDPVGQVDAAVADFEPPVRVVRHRDPLPLEALGDRRRLQQEQHLVVLEREAVGHGAFLAPREHVVEAVGGRQAMLLN